MYLHFCLSLRPVYFLPQLRCHSRYIPLQLPVNPHLHHRLCLELSSKPTCSTCSRGNPGSDSLQGTSTVSHGKHAWNTGLVPGVRYLDVSSVCQRQRELTGEWPVDLGFRAMNLSTKFSG